MFDTFAAFPTPIMEGVSSRRPTVVKSIIRHGKATNMSKT